MKILNRGFISIKPTNELRNWKIIHAKEEIIEPENIEPTVYLIEDDFWDDDEILRKYFKKITKQELNALSESIDCFPEIESIDDFSIYFEAEFGTFVFDLLKTSIDSDKVEL
jgi:hypothetical protein